MGSFTGYISSWMWCERFWLPDKVHWSDMERTEDTFLPQIADLWVQFPLAIGLYLVRLIWEYTVADPIGKWYKLKEIRSHSPVENKHLETTFSQSNGSVPSNSEVKAISKEINWTTRRIQRWWRKRHLKGKPSELTRFKESSWRFIFYLTIFYYSMYVLYDKPWFENTKNCWYSWPRQHITEDIYWYYMIELGFYWSLILSLMKDVKRKDFWQHVIHHIVTIFLMTFSWVTNFVRIGTLVLAVCDAGDYWLEAAKVTKYLKYHKLSNIICVIFSLVWFVTRLYLYPVKIMTSASYESWTILGPFYACFFFNFLLFILMILNVMWSITLVKMIHKALQEGEVKKDYRSDSDSE